MIICLNDYNKRTLQEDQSKDLGGCVIMIPLEESERESDIIRMLSQLEQVFLLLHGKTC